MHKNKLWSVTYSFPYKKIEKMHINAFKMNKKKHKNKMHKSTYKRLASVGFKSHKRSGDWRQKGLSPTNIAETEARGV